MAPARYLAEYTLTIDGKTVSEKLTEDILQISVEESLHRPAMFTISIRNSYFSGQEDDPAWQYQKDLKIGKSIKIGFKSSTTESQEFRDVQEGSVIEGEITAIETHFTSGSQAPIVIRGYDVSHRLHRGRHNRSFQNYTDSDIVKLIAGETGIAAGTIDSSGSAHDYVFQENQTNMEFLRERAARNGFELFVQDGKLHFRKPSVDESLQLKWLQEITSFHVQVSSAEQVKQVEVRGWDYQQKKAIVSTRTSGQTLTKTGQGIGSSTSTSFKENPSNPKMIVVDQPVFTSKEADTIAQALLNELSGEFVQADATAEGNPEIRPGRVIKLQGMNDYDGDYYVTETRHLFVERVYTTEFSVRGLRGADLLTTLSPASRLQPGQTLLVGCVTNNKDPKGWGRVRVKFPTLSEEHESNWARVVSVGAGSSRGFDCLPEVNDEVLVAFEHGDIHRPYVIGGVWNGMDAPPEKVDATVVDGKVRLRTLKTRTGHMLQFVEEDKDSTKKGIYIKTTGGHHIRLNDSAKFVELETTGGHVVRMDDSNKSISMTSTGDINIKAGKTGLSNRVAINAGEIALTGTQRITLTVGPSKVEVSPTGITIQTGANITIQGGPITEVKGGIVQVQGGLIKLN